MTVFILLAALCLLLLSPYIMLVYKRMKALRRLTRFANKNGFRVRRLHRLVCLARNRAPRYDLLFENNERAFAVKLWSAVNAGGTLVINADGSACERTVLPPELDTQRQRERIHTTKRKPVPRTRVNFRIKQDKPLECIMLCEPPNKAMVLRRSGRTERLEIGERVFGKILCTPQSFAQMLAKYSTKNVKAAGFMEKTVEKSLGNHTKQM